jgi:hypothetical protein
LVKENYEMKGYHEPGLRYFDIWYEDCK